MFCITFFIDLQSNGDGVNYPIREKYKSMLERYLLALRQGSAEEGLSI